MKASDILKRPVVTEKANLSLGRSEYVFRVDRKTNKRQIAQAVREAFAVQVKKVRTLRYAEEKRAIVRLGEGEKITVFETGE